MLNNIAAPDSRIAAMRNDDGGREAEQSSDVGRSPGRAWIINSFVSYAGAVM